MFCSSQPLGRVRGSRSRARRTVSAYAANSWPSRMGTASCMCVRPDLSTPSKACAALRERLGQLVEHAAAARATRSSVATRIAVGNVSLVDWAMFTWSLGLTTE